MKRVHFELPQRERDKTADLQNGTKQPIYKTGQNSRFLKRQNSRF